MMKIFKYPLEITDHSELLLPAGAKILSVIEQDENIVLYAMVDPTMEYNKSRKIRIVGTGHEIDDLMGFTFLGTVSLIGGKLIFHIFYL